MNEWFEAEQHVERAHELYEAGRWDEAERELRRALSLNPFRAEWHFNLGLTLEAAGRFDDAMRAFNAAYELNPDDAQTLVMLGVNALRSERSVEALTWLERAQQTDPDRIEAFIHAIEALALLGRHDEAEHAFYRALQLEAPDAEATAQSHAQAYANMGEAMMLTRDWERAIYCFREAASLDEGMSRVHARLAAAYAETGRQERARQLYLRELREAPGDIDTLLDLGCLLVDMSRFGEAGEKFRRVLELESDNADAHFYLADLALRQGQRREAESQFTLVLRLDAEYPEARRRLAELALDRGDLTEARRLLRREMRAFRQRLSEFNPSDLEDFGKLLLDAKLSREAAKVLAVLVERVGRPAGEVDAADERTATEHAAPDEEPFNETSGVAAEAEAAEIADDDGAPASGTSGTRRRRTDEAADAWHALGVARLSLGDRRGGVEAERRALRLKPDMIAALHNMALASIHDRKWSRARSYIRRMEAVDRDDPALRRLKLTVRVCRLLALSGDFARRVTGRAETARPLRD